MDDYINRTSSLLNNIDYHKNLLAQELQEEYSDFYTLAESFEQILENVFKLMSTDTNTSEKHKESQCHCYEKINHVFPWIIYLEVQIQEVISREILTDESECWLFRMLNKYRLLRMWFERMRHGTFWSSMIPLI